VVANNSPSSIFGQLQKMVFRPYWEWEKSGRAETRSNENPKDLVKQKQVKPKSLFICGKGEKVVCGDWSKCRLDQMLLQTVVI